MSIKKAHVLIRGQVQGVGYRFFAQKTARQHGLTGWVKNNKDGSVEVDVEGEEAVIKSFLNTLRTKHPWAKIEALDIDWSSAAQEYQAFEITQ